MSKDKKEIMQPIGNITTVYMLLLHPVSKGKKELMQPIGRYANITTVYMLHLVKFWN